MVLVKTAYSSHKKCLICGQRTNLRQIKLDSIVYAWSKHKILIKHHARTCCRHIDSNGLILHDWFTRIRTREINYGIETIRRMDSGGNIFIFFRTSTGGEGVEFSTQKNHMFYLIFINSMQQFIK